MQDVALAIDTYWRLLSKRGWIIITAICTISISSFIFSLLEKPVYLAKATLAIEPQILNDVPALRNITISQEMEEIRRLAQSKELLYRLGDEAYKYGALLASPEHIQQMLSNIKGDFDIEDIEGTNLIELRVRGENPKEIALFANTIAQAYVDLTLKQKIEAAKRWRSFLEAQSGIHGRRLNEVEKGLLGFEKDIETLEREKTLLTNKLLKAQLEYLSLKQVYSAQNPQINELKAQIKLMQERLKELVKEETERLRLHREIKIETQEYKDYLFKTFDVRAQADYQRPDVRLVEWAVEPSAPASPNKVKNVSIGALLGLIIGIAIISFIEHCSTSLGTVEAVESFVRLPVLGTIPYLGLKERAQENDIEGMRKRLLFNYTATSTEMESYRYLRMNILSKVSASDKSFLLTSAGMEEGKSITAANLALTLADLGKRILLVDGDLRRPILHSIFDVSMQPGLADILLKDLEFKDVIRGLLNIKGLFFLPCGNLPGNSAEVLASNSMKLLIDRLRADFDIILFDSPPVLPVADARILGSELDKTLLLYRAVRTNRDAFLRAKVEMEQAGSAMLGIIINGLNIVKR